jgi:hypothetical protein
MSKKILSNDELITWCRKEAARNAQMQGDKENRTNRRRKTFRYRNHMLAAVADRFKKLDDFATTLTGTRPDDIHKGCERQIQELTAELSDQHVDMKILWDAIPKQKTEISVHVAAADYIGTLKAGIKSVMELIDDSGGVYGLHLNGDGASWDSLRTGGFFEEWLLDFDKAQEAGK